MSGPCLANATEFHQSTAPVVACHQWITYKLVVVTYKTRFAGTPAYLIHKCLVYQHAHCDCCLTVLLFSVPSTELVLSANAFSVSTHSTSAELLSTFKHISKTKLFDIGFSESVIGPICKHSKLLRLPLCKSLCGFCVIVG